MEWEEVWKSVVIVVVDVVIDGDGGVFFVVVFFEITSSHIWALILFLEKLLWIISHVHSPESSNVTDFNF